MNWLQSKTTGYGNGWRFRISEYGRGCRLHETSHPLGEPDVRDAIDKAMDDEEVGDGKG